MQDNICLHWSNFVHLYHKNPDVGEWRQDCWFWIYFELRISNDVTISFAWHICHKDIFSVTPRAVWPRRYLGWIRCYLDCHTMPNCRPKHWRKCRESAAREASFLVIWAFLFLLWGSLMFLGWVLTLKLWTVWQTNYYVVYRYFMNIISIF